MTSSQGTMRRDVFDTDHAEKLANVVAGTGVEIPEDAGDRVSFIMAELVLQAVAEVRGLRDDLKAVGQAATAIEREACARVVELWETKSGMMNLGAYKEEMAAEIRARGNS